MSMDIPEKATGAKDHDSGTPGAGLLPLITLPLLGFLVALFYMPVIWFYISLANNLPPP